MIELLQQLTPIYGPLSALLIVGIVVIGWFALKKDSETKDLRKEKDADLKEVYDKFIDMSAQNIASNKDLAESNRKVAENVAINNALTSDVKLLLSNYNAVLAATNKNK